VIDTAPRFAAWVNALAPDVYLISGSADIGWVTLPLLNSAIATMAIAHNDAETFYIPVRHYQRFLTGVVGVSPEICELFHSKCGIAKDRIKWIPYGVVAAQEPPKQIDSASINLIFAGRVVEEQKRISDVIKITRRLTEENAGFRLIIVGDGEEMPLVREELKVEIEKGSVVLKGWLSNEEVIGLFRGSEIFLLTSAYEGFCISLIEAMANGCCPLVTDIRSGNRYLVQQGENGYLLEVGDTEGFVNKVKELGKNKELLSALRNKAWEMGSAFSHERMISSYMDLFSGIIKDAKKLGRTTDRNFPLLPTCVSKYPDWLRRIKFRLTGK